MKIHNILKTCSVLPALLVMPAMAETFTTEQPLTESKVWNVSNSDVAPTDNASVLFASGGADVVVKSGSLFENNKAGSGTVYIGTTSKVKVESGTKFIENEMAYDGGAIANFGTLIADDILMQGNIAQANAPDDDIPVGGGALALGSSSNTVLTGSDLINNESFLNGGAIGMRHPDNGVQSAAKLSLIDNDFEGNKATGIVTSAEGDAMVMAGGNGGAIYNTLYSSNVAGYEDSVFLKDNDFVNNQAAVNGGAIYNSAGGAKDPQGGVMTIVDGDFTGNKAVGYMSKDAKGKDMYVGGRGGAIYNEGTMTINGGDFESNIAEANGGAIFSQGTLNVSGTETDAVDFERNSGSQGGAIDARGNTTITHALFDGNKAAGWAGAVYLTEGDAKISNSKFINNNAATGGALAAGYSNKSMTITDTVFEKNFADQVGALGLFSSGKLTNVKFIGNYTTDVEGDDGSGALYLGAKSATGIGGNISESLFEGNTSASHAGALGTRNFEVAVNELATLDISNTTFNKNIAKTNGGAINNHFYHSTTVADAVYIADSHFLSNQAGFGAGIYNHGHDTTQQATGDVQAGAIVLNNVTFDGNIATTAGGAIYNERGAKITLTGKNTFKGNIAAKMSNDIHNLGAVTIANGETNINGGITGTGALTIADGATLNINTATVTQESLDLGGTLAMSLLKGGRDNGTLYSGKLDVKTITGDGKVQLNISSVGTYDIVDRGTLAVSQIDYGQIYTGTFNKDTGEVTVVTKSIEEIAKDANLNTETATIVSGLANSDNATASLISLRAQEALANGESAYVEKELAKTKPEGKPVAQSVAQSVQNQVVSVAAGRMNPVVGRAGGDSVDAAYGMWAQGLFNKSKMGSDFHGYTRGVAIGADALINKTYTVGIGAAFNNSDVHADGGRHTDIDSTSLFTYGQYKPAEWFVNGTVSYTMSKYDETARSMGVLLSNDHDVDAFGAQLMAGYDFNVGLTPEIGMRYLHVNQDSYTNAIGDKVGEAKSDLLTGVAGLRYAFEIENEGSEFKWMPELRAAATYDMVSDADVATVTMPGGAAYVVGGDNLSRMGGEFGLGLTMQYRGLDVSLNYELDLHKDYTSQTGMLKFRYDF